MSRLSTSSIVSLPHQAATLDPNAVDVERGAHTLRVWSQTTLTARLQVVRRLRHLLAEHAEELAGLIEFPQRTALADTLAAEILPLADACRYLERNAATILATRYHGSWLRWMGFPAVTLEVRREPLGLILVIGPSNYPLFLPAVQALQAIVAGNIVKIKPGRGGQAVLLRLVELLGDAGLPRDVIRVLDESTEAAQTAIDNGVSKVVLTGSSETGRQVLRQLAETITPAVMELSGCDPLIVLADADLERVAAAIAFSLRFNGGATCIAPRRVLVAESVYSQLQYRLVPLVAALPTITAAPEEVQRGRRLIGNTLAASGKMLIGDFAHQLPEDRFAPTVLVDCWPALADDLMLPIVLMQPFTSADDLQRHQLSYDLGASVFGSPAAARAVAARVRAGCITINDVIVPTADPRLPFGAGGVSGFGVTRGAEGLLEMTRLRVIATRYGKWLPHLDPPQPSDAALLNAWLKVQHSGTWLGKLAAGRELMQIISQRGRS